MIKGVKQTINNADGVWLCIIEEFSEELKDLIRTRLSSICHGSSTVQSNSDVYSYKKTLKEFLDRYEKKGDKIQKGMIGELLSHILIIDCDKNMMNASPFFNLEEQSIKKGFDLVSIHVKTKDLWFSEVKSGNANGEKAHIKNGQLLNNAKNGIKTKLDENRNSVWLNAISGARITLENNKEIGDMVKEILEQSLGQSQDGKSDSSYNNVILISVLYQGPHDTLVYKNIQDFKNSVTKESIFKRVIVFSIQKETYQKIHEFLEAEAK